MKRRNEAAQLERYLDYGDLVEMGLVGNRRTLARWIDKEGFPAVKLAANTIRFPESKLLAWVESRKVGGDK